MVYRLLDFPDCLPQQEDQLEAVLEKIEAYLEDTEALLNLIKEDDANKTRIEELTAKLAGKQPPYAAGLYRPVDVDPCSPFMLTPQFRLC